MEKKVPTKARGGRTVHVSLTRGKEGGKSPAEAKVIDREKQQNVEKKKIWKAVRRGLPNDGRGGGA